MNCQVVEEVLRLIQNCKNNTNELPSDGGGTQTDPVMVTLLEHVYTDEGNVR